MNHEAMLNVIQRTRGVFGVVLLVSGVLASLVNEFVMDSGARSILGTGGEPSVIGLVLIIAGLILRQCLASKKAL